MKHTPEHSTTTPLLLLLAHGPWYSTRERDLNLGAAAAPEGLIDAAGLL
jgi:hypothetical protein